MSKQIHSISRFFSRPLFLIAGMGMASLSILVTGCAEQNTESGGTMSPEAVAERIAPAGKVNITRTPEAAREDSKATDDPVSSDKEAPEKPSPNKEENVQGTAPDQTPPATSKANPQLAHGTTIAEKNCAACHTGNLPGAPAVGNPEDWKPRLTQGEKLLIQHAIKGYKAMPPRGGNPNLSDEDIVAAVAYFISQAHE